MTTRSLAGPIAVLFAAGSLLASTSGCVRPPLESAQPFVPAKVDANGDAQKPTRDVYVLLLILDGARADIIYRAVDDGLLPNLKEHVFDRGVRVNDAVTVFPSVTTSGHQAFITGLLPGHSGITGLDWFDRSSGRVTDYLSFDVLGIREDLLSKTAPVHPDELFDAPDNLIDDLRGIPRAAIYEPFHMGIADRGPKVIVGEPMVNFVFHRNLALTSDAADRVKLVYERPLPQIPRFVMATFLGHDVAQHHSGPESPEMLEEMKLEDRELGAIVERIKKAGIWDKTYIVLSSDHGQHATGRYVSVPKLLRDAGLRPRGFYSAKVNTFASQVAITSANIYLNKGDWRDLVSLDDLRSFPTAGGGRVDLVGSLISNPAIEFALIPESPDRVHILASGKRHGMVTRRSFRGVDHFSYATVGNAGDPLGYADSKGVSAWVNDGRFHHGDAWGLASVDSGYPDAPVQLLQLFDGDRAGDLVVTAAPGWHFRPREYVSSHGGMGRSDMRVPLVISGPDIAKGVTVPFARTTDVYPPLRRVIGMKVSTARMDGRPLDEILPFVPDAKRVGARGQPNDAEETYFTALSALESFIAPIDGTGGVARDPAALFRELKAMDYEAFSLLLEQEVRRDADLLHEIVAMRTGLEHDVHGLARSVRDEGREDYNDGLYRERRQLKRSKERIYILSRTQSRLDARLARSARLKQVLELVRIADDVEELRELYVSAQQRPKLHPEDRKREP